MRLVPLQTTIARSLAEASEASWREHNQACPKCGRRRERCRTGEDLYQRWTECRGEYEHQRQLDKEPNPDQGELFPVDAGRGVIL